MKHPPITSGPTVHQWQAQLRDRGWNIGVDGKYGPISKRLCTNFQREHHIHADGIVGPITWQDTWEAPSSHAPPPPHEILQLGSTGTDVRTWQHQVDARGETLEVDGRFGTATEAVCRALQQFKGLPVTGRVDHATWEAAWQEKVPVTA